MIKIFEILNKIPKIEKLVQNLVFITKDAKIKPTMIKEARVFLDLNWQELGDLFN